MIPLSASSSSSSSSSSSEEEDPPLVLPFYFHSKCFTDEIRQQMIKEEKADEDEFNLQTVALKIRNFDDRRSEHQSVAKIALESMISHHAPINAGLIPCGSTMKDESSFGYLFRYDASVFASAPYLPLKSVFSPDLLYQVIPFELVLTVNGLQNSYDALNSETITKMIRSVLKERQSPLGSTVFLHCPQLNFEESAPKVLVRKCNIFVICTLHRGAANSSSSSSSSKLSSVLASPERYKQMEDFRTLLVQPIVQLLTKTGLAKFNQFMNSCGWTFRLECNSKLPEARFVAGITHVKEQSVYHVYYNVAGFDGLAPVFAPKSVLCSIFEEERRDKDRLELESGPGSMAVTVIQQQQNAAQPNFHVTHVTNGNALRQLRTEFPDCDLRFSSCVV
jgi:hypothetical protein